MPAGSVVTERAPRLVVLTPGTTPSSMPATDVSSIWSGRSRRRSFRMSADRGIELAGGRAARRRDRTAGQVLRAVEHRAAGRRRADVGRDLGERCALVRRRERDDGAERRQRRVGRVVRELEERVDHHPALRVRDEVDLAARMRAGEGAELVAQSVPLGDEIRPGVGRAVRAAAGPVGEPADLAAVVAEGRGVEAERRAGRVVGVAVDAADREEEVARAAAARRRRGRLRARAVGPGLARRRRSATPCCAGPRARVRAASTSRSCAT